jgi:hypothetical protein
MGMTTGDYLCQRLIKGANDKANMAFSTEVITHIRHAAGAQARSKRACR